jgi:hypothetical protein
MAQRSPLRNVTAALGITGVLAVGLTGCGGGGEASSAASSSGPEAAVSPTTSPTASAVPSTAAPAAPAAGGELTAPGTKLKTGESAVTHSNTGKDKTDPKYVEALFTSTLTGVVAGMEADLSEFKDAAKFAGQTPYYVSVSHRLDSLSKPSAGISEPKVTAQLKDGTEAQSLIVFGSFDKCKDTSFETSGTGDTLSLAAGSTKISCQVFLAPAGDEITHVAYEDSRFTYAKYSDNLYLKNPVLWSK